jgi:hypothetical protein
LSNSKTAILLFSRSLEEEFRAKSIGLTKERFRLFYHALLKKTRETLLSVDLPLIAYNSTLQSGNTFGERLVNAIKHSRKNGYESLIIVGNDAPDLSPEILRAAIDEVNAGNSVLGRDAHGGCYLMGFQIDELDLLALEQVEWQSSKVFDQVDSLLQTTTLLPELVDINRKGDLKKALAFSSQVRSLIIDLIKLVFGTVWVLPMRLPSLSDTIQTSLLLRGPPSPTRPAI